jgi:hypothetical protein
VLLIPKAVNVYPEPDPLAGMDQLEFYGQRAWRPGKLSAEPPDPSKEKLGIQALQYQEKHRVNHAVSETEARQGNSLSPGSKFSYLTCVHKTEVILISEPDNRFLSRMIIYFLHSFHF